MAANTNPIFGLVPVCKTVQISSANTARDGTGALGAVVTGGTNGTRIDRVTVKATGTTTAGMVRLFIDDTVNIRLLTEVAVAAITPSATLKTFEAELVRTDGLAWEILPSGSILKASTHNAEIFNVCAHAQDF